ncbi:EAL domain-containing protein [Bradyrhizobium diazoefficiens]|nr:EAL domain-containing protein [Bradyrhizobium diazoefficiens]MBR0963252.1 EAL domain-containing protein [Bradyrhizobium diazoefficiens]MBR0976066.1 EAL domain-containing protein [Bradyrhizobium diazoefficiens]MBR1006914.1 EAL domain-containing protein [Bradyrhizobium diazoefficiens]MBR1013025.1 EAL domain-containing protein [Bradyrhizobium diazoefficiens]MBR1049845.1 EAL domain-containing protein [Bradyrhizobium diazoefficiens]
MSASDCPVTEMPEVLRAALECADDAILVVDAAHRITHFNAAAERIWKLARTEVLGRDVAVLDLEFLQTASGASFRDEISLVRRDGSQIRALVSVASASVGEATHRIVFARDVTAEAERNVRIGLLNAVSDQTNRVVIITDTELNIRYVNSAFTSLFGYTAAEAEGRRVVELIAGCHTNRTSVARLYKRLMAGGRRGKVETLTYNKDGEEIWVSARIDAFRDKKGRARHIFALLEDITETRQLHSLQQLIMGALADEIPITEIADRLCRRVEQIAPDVVCSLLHVDSAGLIHPLGGPSLPEDYSRALDGVAIGPSVGSCGTAAFYGEPVLATDLDTDPRWQPYKAGPLGVGLRACWSTPIKAKDGRVIATFAFYFREQRAPSSWHRRIVDACVHLGAFAIERKEARAEIARLAYHDILTGLPNRAQLRHLITTAIDACPAGSHVALAFLDVDHFKDVNDTLGHAAGDELLVQLAQRLREHIGPQDMLGRLGGDEFVILLPQRNAESAERAAAGINEGLSAPLRLGSRHLQMSASIGISLYPDLATDIDTLMQQADAAMYMAKQAGRSTHRMFSAEMNGLAEQRLALIAALRRAVAEGTLTLSYQPQIRSRDGDIHGVEALARWHDAALGDISPAKFIPLAEECGLIEQIGLWSVREACRQMALWRRAGLEIPSVSVNLSPNNFRHVALAARLKDILAEYELPADALMLEITEGTFLQDGAAALETMQAIRALGIGLSVDDFGTGYSSLSRLAHLPIRELKIDRSFMRDIERDAGAVAIATAVIRVGQGLGMTVVAEGVETEGQRKVLAELGCDVVQGFLYAPALPPIAFEHWLIEHCAEQARAMLARLKVGTAGREAVKLSA